MTITRPNAATQEQNSPPKRGSGVRDPAASKAWRKPIKAAIAAADWPRALRLARQEAERASTWAAGAALVRDWGPILEHEAEILADEGVTDLAELPGDLAGILLDARRFMGRQHEALEIARRIAAHDPGNFPVRKRLVGLLRHFGQQGSALDTALSLWKDSGLSGLAEVVSCLIRMGEFGLCARILDNVPEVMAQEKPAVLLNCRRKLAVATGDHPTELALISALQGLVSEADHALFMLGHAQRTGREDLLAGPMATLMRWMDEPAARRELLNAGPQIIDQLWKRRPDEQFALHVLDRITAHVLPPDSARRAAGTLWRLGQHDKVLGLLSDAVAVFPSALGLWTTLLNYTAQIGDSEALAALHARLKVELPAPAAMQALIDASSTAWPKADLPALAAFVEDSRDPALADAFDYGLFALPELPEDAEHEIAARPGHAAPLEALQFALVLQRSHDRRLLQRAVLAPVAFSAFLENRTRSAQKTADWAEACVVATASGAAPSADQSWFGRSLTRVNQLLQAADAALPATSESFAEAAALTDFLVARILSGTATSAISLDECTCAFLPGNTCPAAVLAQRDNCSTFWWGQQRPDPAAESTLIAALQKALARADVLGVLPLWHLAKMARHGETNPGTAACEHGLARIQAMGPMNVVTSTHFAGDMDRWSLWDEVFAATKSVSWISRRDLAPFLHRTHGIKTRLGIRPPAETASGGIFPQDPAVEPDRGLFDLHEDICRSLEPEPGEVWLVANGVFGKIYCDVIRQRGGIGIDIGGMDNSWLGLTTHSHVRFQNDMLSPALLSLHGRDRPQPDAATIRTRIKGLDGVVRSSDRGGWNIADAHDAAPPPPEKTATLRIIGHPRCASGYMATVFSARGLLIGHETMARDGISSWMHVVQDHNLPYSDNATITHRFRHTILHLRDPAAAIPSIMLENGIARSFDFRRGHILRATDHDIAGFADPVARAVASYVLWNKMALSLSPDAVIAVEHAEEVVPAWLDRAGLAHSAQPAVSGIAGYNASTQKKKFVTASPVISPGAWQDLPDALPAHLREGLEELCALGGYPLPWNTAGGAA